MEFLLFLMLVMRWQWQGTAATPPMKDVQLEFAFMADTDQNCGFCRRWIPASKRVIDQYGQYCSKSCEGDAAHLRFANGV